MKFLQRYEDIFQLLSGLGAAVWVGYGRWRLGAAWWQWLPLAFLAWVCVQSLWVMVWFLRRKLTYQRHAAANKADLRAGGDGWPRQREARSPGKH